MSITPTPSDNEEDFDIYDDLLDSTLKENSTEEKCDVKLLKERISSLEIENETLRNNNKSLLDMNKNLSCNISVLYKTAAEEIKRKDKAIEDLRRELDSYLFRRNGRKPPNLGFKNAQPSMQKENLGQQPDRNSPVQTATANSIINMKPEDPKYKEPSSSPRERPPCDVKSPPSPENKKHPIPEVKAQRIIKEVPKKRKVIEYNDVEQKKPTDKSTTDKVIVKPKLSVFDRLGYRKSTTFHEKKTDTTSSPNFLHDGKQWSDTKKERTFSKSNERKEDCLQSPVAEASSLPDANILMTGKASNVAESPKTSLSGEVEVPPLPSLTVEPGDKVEQPSDLMQSSSKEGNAECNTLVVPSQPVLASCEDKVLPENCVPFQPPLPIDDPLPPPPLPSSTPPPTPIKEVKSDAKNELLVHNDSASSGLILAQKEASECSKMLTDAGVKPESPEECDKNKRHRWSDENLHMQCPFKPRRRAKSVVVVEDAVDGDSKINFKSLEPPKVETSSRPSKASDKIKRTPLKKSDIQENRLSSDHRSYQTQRSVHGNRHLSLKSYVHLPERRSPSELLNGRSGRIARISHQDKVRARYHDRRSRSLSPQKSRVREDELRTKICLRPTTIRDSNRRTVTEDNGGKMDKSHDERKSRPLKKKTEVHKIKQKMNELFGESSPEPEEKPSKNLNGNLKSAHSLPARTLETVAHKEETSLFAASLKPPTTVDSSVPPLSINNKHPEEDVIIIKRRPRSFIKFGNSEDAAQNTQSLTVQKSEQSSTSFSSTASKENNDASNLHVKKVRLSQTEELDSNRTVVANPVAASLYFRERGVKRSSSDDGIPDDDLIGESDESATNADSDDTYNPKTSLRKSSKRKPSKRKK